MNNGIRSFCYRRIEYLPLNLIFLILLEDKKEKKMNEQYPNFIFQTTKCNLILALIGNDNVLGSEIKCKIKKKKEKKNNNKNSCSLH